MITLNVRHGCACCALLSLGIAPAWAASPLEAPWNSVAALNCCALEVLGSSIPKASKLPISQDARPTLICQNKSEVSVSTPSSNDVLTFVLTNHAKNTEVFGLTRTNGGTPSRRFHYVPRNSVLYDSANSPTGAIFLETNNVPGFQPGSDVAYLPHVNDPVLASGASKTIYVLSDTPLVEVGSHGEVLLTATAGSPQPSSHAMGAVDWWDTPPVMVSAMGTYSATALGLLMTRSAMDHFDTISNKSLAQSTTLTYRVVVKLKGRGTAKNMVITEPAPVHLRYVPASISVEGVPQTEIADADHAQFMPRTSAVASSVAVSLGNIGAPISWTISFRATIK